MNRPIQLVFGAEYIYAQANFSDALAFVEQDLVNGGETWHCFDFDYNSSYGFYGGVYLPDCGGVVLFNFRRMTSDADFAATSTSTVDIFGPFEIDDNIEGQLGRRPQVVRLELWQDDSAGLPAGVRLRQGLRRLLRRHVLRRHVLRRAAVAAAAAGGAPRGTSPGPAAFASPTSSWTRGLDAFDPLNSNAFIDGYQTRMNFDGFGGRVGLMGRRYIGRRGLVSLYAKGDWSLLIGRRRARNARHQRRPARRSFAKIASRSFRSPRSSSAARYTWAPTPR